jgi:hypothetical protein
VEDEIVKVSIDAINNQLSSTSVEDVTVELHKNENTNKNSSQLVAQSSDSSTVKNGGIKSEENILGPITSIRSTNIPIRKIDTGAPKISGGNPPRKNKTKKRRTKNNKRKTMKHKKRRTKKNRKHKK